MHIDDLFQKHVFRHPEAESLEKLTKIKEKYLELLLVDLLFSVFLLVHGVIYNSSETYTFQRP